MQTNELRQKYLDFFATKGHAVRPSDVLVPTWDPSVLFTPAGMNQFKDHFLGRVKLDFTRAATCQKCLRTGDIDNVGRTAYHHTFFEMLGNFSFGDYFKRDAINWAWEFLTDKKWLGFDPGLLSATVYLDDDEAAGIWARDVGLPADRIVRMEEDENFWPASAPSQGPDGVCGPCSEIYYHPPGGGKEVEIWNLVFTQFNRVGAPPNNLRPLPSKNIDTGMGLERTAATLQGVDTNYHIDILRPIVEASAQVCGVEYIPDSDNGRRLRRITDHVRACAFAIHENVYPGANKEKYVIRRLLRRAVLDGRLMGLHDPFLYQIVPAVVEQMKAPYPDLTETQQRVADVIRQEESNFFGTIDRGLARIEQAFEGMNLSGRQTVAGQEAFDLYQTYGVPPELFEAIAAEQNYSFDWEGFRKAMKEHSENTNGGQLELFKEGPIEALKKALQSTEFSGYETPDADVEIKGIIFDGQLCDSLTELGDENEALLVLNSTPFYAESGGQVGDSGKIACQNFHFIVTDTQRDGDLVLHQGYLAEGALAAGDQATASVDADRRAAMAQRHSATHLLHYALQKTLGEHAQQQGSKVEADWLRFDFTNMSPVEPEQLAEIESTVSQLVGSGASVEAQVLPLADAREAGAMMLFGEKYPDPVRMVSMGDFSRELCGGTHLADTSLVEAFDIISEENISAGTRRITALTGERAKENIEKNRSALARAAEALGLAPGDVPEAALALGQQVREYKKCLSSGNDPKEFPMPESKGASAEVTDQSAKHLLRETARRLSTTLAEVPTRLAAMQAEIESLKKQVAERATAGTLTADDLLAQAVTVGDAKVIAAEVPGCSPNVLRQLIDQLRKKAAPCAVLLATRAGGKAPLVAGVSPELIERGVHAGNWVREAATILGGGGGGKPDMAQAGGKDPDKIPEALDAAREMVVKILT